MGFFSSSKGRPKGKTGRNPQSGCTNSVSSSSGGEGGQSESHQSLESMDLQQAVPTVNLTVRRLQDWKNAGNGNGGAPPPPARRRGVDFSPSVSALKQSPATPSQQQQHASSSPNTLILLIERGQWAAASERARSHPQEVKQLAKLRKTTAGSSIPPIVGNNDDASRKKDLRISNVKCKALHHACQKLRSVHTTFYQHPATSNSQANIIEEDEYIEACKCLLTLIQVHPEACRERESRHGCLPLHLCVFSMCDTPPPLLPPPLAAASTSATAAIGAPPVPSTATMSSSDRIASSNAGGNDCAGVGDILYDGLKMIFGNSTSFPASSQQPKQQLQRPTSSSSAKVSTEASSNLSNHHHQHQHHTIHSNSSADFSLGNMSQMIQEESDHQRALTDHQQSSNSSVRRGPINVSDQEVSHDNDVDDGGIGDTTFALIQKGMDDMEKLLIGLESKYEKKEEEKRRRGKGDSSMMKMMKKKLSNKNNKGEDPPGDIPVETSSASKTTTTILNSITPMDCLDERSRETDSHSTPQHHPSGNGMPQFSSSTSRDGRTQQPFTNNHRAAATSNNRSGSILSAPPSLLKPSSYSKPPQTAGNNKSPTISFIPPKASPSNTVTTLSYEDLQRRYLQINTQRREEYSVRVINALLDAWPKSVKTASEGGRLPLHMACFGKASVKVMETILKAYPDAARQRNHDGFLPVHIAAHWGVSHPDVAPLLLTAYPDGAVGRNRWERTPIEEALGMAGENGRQHQLSLVWSLRRHPTYWIHNDIASMLLPRNVRMAPWRLVEMNEDDEYDEKEDNIDEFPGSSTMAKNEDEKSGTKVPSLGKLGRVISGGSSATAIAGGAVDVDAIGSSDEELEGVEVQMRRSQSKANSSNHVLSPSALARTTELSLLITKEKNWAAAALRCTSHPHEAREAMEVKVRGAYTAKITPLHYACEHKPSVQVIQTLIAANPTALERRQEPGGQLPLHAACTWGASAEVVHALLSSLPSSAEMKDFLSNLALHCACYSGADTAVIELLLRVYPQSVLPRNHQGSSAADIVKRLCHPNRKEVLYLLENTMSGLLQRVAPENEENLEMDNNNLEWV